MEQDSIVLSPDQDESIHFTATKETSESSNKSTEEVAPGTPEGYTTILNTKEEGKGHAKGVILNMLDELEKRVDDIRSNALILENEKDNILCSLDSLISAQMISFLGAIDRDEITRYVERLAKRCLAVQVDIKTERSPPQMDSLHKVNNLIDGLILDLKSDAANTQRKCITYMNACSEEVIGKIPDIDSTFEMAVLGCSVEDQKEIKKRLTGLHFYFKTTTTQEFGVFEEEAYDEDLNQAIENSLSQGISDT